MRRPLWPGEEAPEAAEATMEMLPVTPEEIAQVEQIVREAVGIDAGRGDSVSISSAQFQTFVPELPEEPGSWIRCLTLRVPEKWRLASSP